MLQLVSSHVEQNESMQDLFTSGNETHTGTRFFPCAHQCGRDRFSQGLLARNEPHAAAGRNPKRFRVNTLLFAWQPFRPQEEQIMYLYPYTCIVVFTSTRCFTVELHAGCGQRFSMRVLKRSSRKAWPQLQGPVYSTARYQSHSIQSFRSAFTCISYHQNILHD